MNVVDLGIDNVVDLIPSRVVVVAGGVAVAEMSDVASVVCPPSHYHHIEHRAAQVDGRNSAVEYAFLNPFHNRRNDLLVDVSTNSRRFH